MKQITFGGNKNVIGKRLSVLRKEKGITQSDLAARMQTLNVNIDQQMISKIEKNQRQVTDYEHVKGKFSVSAYQFQYEQAQYKYAANDPDARRNADTAICDQCKAGRC